MSGAMENIFRDPMSFKVYFPEPVGETPSEIVGERAARIDRMLFNFLYDILNIFDM